MRDYSHERLYQTPTSHEQPSLPCCTAKILKMLLKYFFLIRIKERRRNCISLSISKKRREGGQRLLTDVSAILPQNSWDIYGARSWATPRASSGRSKFYLASRFPYTANDSSTQQLSRIVLGGDIHKNPGPTEKRTPKYPCKECGKGVRSNQDALLCTECNVWSHAKCINLSKAGFKYYLDYPDIEWTCSLCSLPFRFEQSLVGVENLTQHGGEGEYANKDVAGYANDLPEPTEPTNSQLLPLC